MNNATPRQLVIFEAAARHPHCARAAPEFGVSQPSVSRRRNQLEENLGVALFELIGRRTLRGASLGEIGDNTRDLAIIARPPRDPGLVAGPFLEDPLVAIAAPGHPLAGRAPDRRVPDAAGAASVSG